MEAAEHCGWAGWAVAYIQTFVAYTHAAACNRAYTYRDTRRRNSSQWVNFSLQWQLWDRSKLSGFDFDKTSIFSITSRVCSPFKTVNHVALYYSHRYSNRSKWSHSARVSAATVSEMDCIPAVHCGWANKIVAYTDSMVVSAHSEHLVQCRLVTISLD